jgi:hypothetical protein
MSEQIDPKNSSAPEFFTGMNQATPTVDIIWIREQSDSLQDTVRIEWRNSDKKLSNMTRLCEKRDWSIEREEGRPENDRLSGGGGRA